MNVVESQSVRAALREVPAYWRRPQLLAPLGLRAPGAPKQLAVFTGLLVGVMLALMLPLLALWQSQFGLSSPDAYEQVPAEWLPVIAIVAAPVLEELLFRGWLTGRPRALWLLACAIAFVAVLLSFSPEKDPVLTGGGLLAALVAAPAGWFWLRKRATPGWFAAAFPALFYVVATIFALAHAMNYSSFSLIALPLVLPQLWAGLVLGFIRMRIGLMGAVLAHAATNAAALAVASLAG